MSSATIKFVPPPLLVCVELNPGPPELTNSERDQVVGFLAAGGTPVEAAKHFGVTRDGIYKLKKKVKETKSVKTRKGRGRKRKLEAKERRAVRRKAIKGEETPQITKEINAKRDSPVSEELIRQTVIEERLQYLVVEEEEELSEKHIEKRLEYCRNNSDTDWKLVFFTDEKMFQLPAGRHKRWQDPKNRMKKPKRPRHAPKLMVWAGIGYYWKSPLVFCKQKNKLNSKGYLEILKDNIPPKTRFSDCPKGKEDDWAFLQDNATIHKTAEVMDYLEQEAPFYVRDHPPLSPDFNIIEDVWSMMNNELNKYNITNIPTLKKYLKKIWKEISLDKVRNCVDSMPRRIEQCISRKGKRTSY